MAQLLLVTQSGIYCPQGDFYIDPWIPVEYAIITHAHPDHARIGHRNYLVHKDSVGMLQHQIGPYLQCHTVDYGECIVRNGVKITLHPAGHIPGSAQVRLEYKGEVWVFTSDFKLSSDGISTDYESIKCHVLVSEGTFGLPLFKWESQEIIFDQINQWWSKNKAQKKQSVLVCNAIGKAQRILRNIDPNIGSLYAHRSIYNINRVLNRQGILVPDTKRLELSDNENSEGALHIIPQNVLNTPWIKSIPNYSLGIVSAWMTLKEQRKKRLFDNHFILSDHADWNQLKKAIINSEAEKVYLTHGYSSSLYRWLREEGVDVHEFQTKFKGEMDELNGKYDLISA
ncbi:MAG: ligase-associated DNA damage response exonuclease [Chitinophagales bacterium]